MYAVANKSSLESKLVGLKGWIERHPDGALIAVGVGSVTATMVFGPALAKTAGLIGILSCASGIILFQKLPKRLGDILPLATVLPENWQEVDPKKWLLKHQLLLDIGVSLGVFFAFGSSLTGLLAASLAGIVTSTTLRVIQLMS